MVAAEHTVSRILESDRAARLVEQHALDPALPGLEEIIEKLFAGTFGMRPVNTYEAEVKRARQLDPLSAIINMAVAEVYTWERHYDEALKEYSRVIELDPSFPGAFGNMAEVYESKHMYAEALQALKHKANLIGDPESDRTLDKVYARSGWSAVTREELNGELQRRSKGHYVNPTGVAGFYAELGDNSHAFEWLQRAYEEHSSGMQFLAVSSEFDSVRSSPQYQYWLGVLALPVIR